MGSTCFLPGFSKKFSLQNGEKTERRKWGSSDSFLCVCTFLCTLPIRFSFSLFSFFFFSSPRRCPFFFFFPPPPFFFFKFLGLGVIVALFFFFPLYFCLTRHDFFLGSNFYFLINWVIAFFFFGCLSLFFLIGHHFLIMVYE